ncbi:hypothetical protein H310_14257 [Aphanomyces invadans]|uniref:C2H2-type domain-containing protein n=1 Tax=Aphanomyces invadans TaxID=157072 RepID=A0A024TBX2_9STRA|nr:hypothetical protein H310_14257 [Aphanomyces invadans]ETV91101.1 hypothetical protein H310_14257 [Aphanomyces invadans]|eukprot:XP_008880297.1 hypothetical protein H310_14257 [Aphanomyces invadans]
MALFRAAKKHMDIMNADLVARDDDHDLSDMSGEEGEEDADEEGEEELPTGQDSDESNEDPFVSRKEVDADEEESEGEGNKDEERAAFLDDFVPTTLEGRNAFRCKVCPKVKLFNEQDVLNHVQSKKHRRACITPEEIARLRARNQRKNAKRRLKHQAELDAKKALANEAKETQAKEKSVQNDGKNVDGKTAKSTKSKAAPTTDEKAPKKAKKAAKA